MSIIDDYAEQQSENRKAEIQRIYGVAKEVAPNAEQAYSYGMPALTYKKSPFLAVATTKEFLSLYPFGAEVIEVMQDKLKGYEQTKGSIHLKENTPLPDSIIKELVLYRIHQIDTKK